MMKPMLPLLIAAAITSLAAAPVTLTVSAAASLKPALETLKPEFEKSHPGISVVFNFGSSGSLKQQIVNGAPVDVFISAAVKPMDELEKSGLISPASRFVLLGNSIVLIANKESSKITGFQDLPEVRTLAIGEPQSVPAGMYAMEVLGHFALLDAVKAKLVFAKDAGQVLVYVGSGNAEAGIVYASDAARLDTVRVVAAAPAGSHQAVTYPAAMVRASPRHREAARFLEFLRSPAASDLFKSLGFGLNDAS